MVQRSPTIRSTMERAKAEAWTPEQLAGAITPELQEKLDCEPEAAIEVAQYLADEFFQLGDAVLLCDRVTGKAIARVTDEDMYQPPMQRREGSTTLAKPLPRLNPNLEGFLVSYIFEEARDRELVASIQARLPATAFLAETGDPRLNALTRGGRAGIAQDVRATLPNVLEAVQGSARAFLDHFVVSPTPPPSDAEFKALSRRTAEARGRQNVVDPKAMNLRFSWEATLRARTGTAWVREMAGYLVDVARNVPAHRNRGPVAHPLLTPEHVAGIPFWTGDPATCIAIQRAIVEGFSPGTFPCSPEHAGAVGLMARTAVGPAGWIVIHPESYSFDTREIHGRWEMLARMEYTIFVNLEVLTYLHVADIPVEAVAEILR